MSFGYYRVGSQADRGGAQQRYAAALAADARRLGGEDDEPEPIGDPPPDKGGPAEVKSAETAHPDTEISSGEMTATQAKQQGYTGDTCDHCGSARMRVSGHCNVCEDCGTTTGCS